MSRLREIFRNKHEEVAAARSVAPLADLRSKAEDAKPTLGFARRLQDSPHPVALIAEVKSKSPSAGTIRADFDPAGIAADYARAGADCLSVLTDRLFFGGDPTYIEVCKKAAQLPTLRKDFIDDPYQVYEARVWEADAILLIVAALEPTQIADLSGLAKSIGLDVLVEVHTKEEAHVAIECGCDLVGVNNRDLSNFRTDLNTSESILPLLSGRIAISESAIESSDDVERVARAGARGVLVGTRFCGSPDVLSAVNEVMRW